MNEKKDSLSLLEIFEDEQRKRRIEQFGSMTMAVGKLNVAMNAMASSVHTLNYTLTQGCTSTTFSVGPIAVNAV